MGIKKLGPAACVGFLLDKVATGQFSAPNTPTFPCHCHPTDGTHSYFIRFPPTLCNIILAADSVIKQNVQREKVDLCILLSRIDSWTPD